MQSHPPKVYKPLSSDEFEEYEDDFEKPCVILEIEDSIDIKGRLLNQQPAYDRLINTEVQMQIRDGIQTGKVVQRSVDPEGHLIGQHDDNSMLNSLLYEVEFTDGSVREYLANVIAQNMLS